jgi:hypothetical protein
MLYEKASDCKKERKKKKKKKKETNKQKKKMKPSVGGGKTRQRVTEIVVNCPCPHPSTPIRGYQGDQGARGGNGTQGNQGKQGACCSGNQGFQGFQGAAGRDGNRGPQGSQGSGFQGSQGLGGMQGIQGDQGQQGPCCPGPQGSQGQKGAQGETGLRGYQGQQGRDGGIGIQGHQGNQGNQGRQGPCCPGPQGQQGQRGLQGFQGLQGPCCGAALVNNTAFVDPQYYATPGQLEDPARPYRTVQGALDAVGALATADSPWEVAVRPGEYAEDVLVANPFVRILGSGAGTTVLRGTVTFAVAASGRSAIAALSVRASDAPCVVVERAERLEMDGVDAESAWSTSAASATRSCLLVVGLSACEVEAAGCAFSVLTAGAEAGAAAAVAVSGPVGAVSLVLRSCKGSAAHSSAGAGAVLHAILVEDAVLPVALRAIGCVDTLALHPADDAGNMEAYRASNCSGLRALLSDGTTEFVATGAGRAVLAAIDAPATDDAMTLDGFAVRASASIRGASSLFSARVGGDASDVVLLSSVLWADAAFLPPRDASAVGGTLRYMQADALGTWAASGGRALAVRTVAADYAAGDGDHTILVDASAGPVTVTLPSVLPAAGGQNPGRIYVVKKIDDGPNVVTVVAAGGASIDGAAAYALRIWREWVLLQNDAVAWWVWSAVSFFPEGNTAFVDAVFGDDAAAVFQDPAKPWRSCSAARNALVAAGITGATIYVRPGAYSETGGLAINNNNWFFQVGANVSSATSTLFNGTGSTGPISMNVWGRARFSTTGFSRVFNFDSVVHSVYFECLSARSDGTNVFRIDAAAGSRIRIVVQQNVTSAQTVADANDPLLVVGTSGGGTGSAQGNATLSLRNGGGANVSISADVIENLGFGAAVLFSRQDLTRWQLTSNTIQTAGLVAVASIVANNVSVTANTVRATRATASAPSDAGLAPLAAVTASAGTISLNVPFVEAVAGVNNGVARCIATTGSATLRVVSTAVTNSASGGGALLPVPVVFANGGTVRLTAQTLSSGYGPLVQNAGGIVAVTAGVGTLTGLNSATVGAIFAAAGETVATFLSLLSSAATATSAVLQTGGLLRLGGGTVAGPAAGAQPAILMRNGAANIGLDNVVSAGDCLRVQPALATDSIDLDVDVAEMDASGATGRGLAVVPPSAIGANAVSVQFSFNSVATAGGSAIEVSPAGGTCSVTGAVQSATVAAGSGSALRLGGTVGGGYFFTAGDLATALGDGILVDADSGSAAPALRVCVSAQRVTCATGPAGAAVRISPAGALAAEVSISAQVVDATAGSGRAIVCAPSASSELHSVAVTADEVAAREADGLVLSPTGTAASLVQAAVNTVDVQGGGGGGAHSLVAIAPTAPGCGVQVSGRLALARSAACSAGVLVAETAPGCTVGVTMQRVQLLGAGGGHCLLLAGGAGATGTTFNASGQQFGATGTGSAVRVITAGAGFGATMIVDELRSVDGDAVYIAPAATATDGKVALQSSALRATGAGGGMTVATAATGLTCDATATDVDVAGASAAALSVATGAAPSSLLLSMACGHIQTAGDALRIAYAPSAASSIDVTAARIDCGRYAARCTSACNAAVTVTCSANAIESTTGSAALVDNEGVGSMLSVDAQYMRAPLLDATAFSLPTGATVPAMVYALGAGATTQVSCSGAMVVTGAAGASPQGVRAFYATGSGARAALSAEALRSTRADCGGVVGVATSAPGPDVQVTLGVAQLDGGGLAATEGGVAAWMGGASDAFAQAMLVVQRAVLASGATAVSFDPDDASALWVQGYYRTGAAGGAGVRFSSTTPAGAGASINSAVFAGATNGVWAPAAVVRPVLFYGVTWATNDKTASVVSALAATFEGFRFNALVS